MNRDNISKRIDDIINLLNRYKVEKNKLEYIEDFLYDIDTCSTKYPCISTPIREYNMGISKIALKDHYALKIYTHLESLYTDIIKNFDNTYTKNNIWNIKIKSFIERAIYKTDEGKKIKLCIIRKKLLENMQNGDEFDNSMNPVYAVFHNYIEWRGANAHYSIGNSPINLDDSLLQIEKYKEKLINLYDKFSRYLIDLKKPTFKIEFKDYK